MITITSPIQNQFHQRDSQNNAKVDIVGVCDFPCKMVVKLADAIVYEENFLDNIKLSKVFTQGVYTAEFYANNRIEKTVNFEVGRVYLVTGHSFAEGVGSSFVTSEKVFIQSNIEGALPEISHFTADVPVYKKITEYAITDKTDSKYNGIWGQFAENLSKKDNCPVLIYHSSWGGTSLKQWAEACKGIRPTGYAGFNENNPADAPYYKTKNILKSLIKNTGLEAVLIMHGENDTNDTAENIESNYKKIIETMRSDASFSELPIYVSRSTWRSDTEKKVIKAQNNVIETSTNVFAGPDITLIGDNGRKRIDTINPQNNDEHLNQEGEKQAAKLWADSIKNYHNKTVVETIIENLKPVIGGSSPAVQQSNVIGSVVVFLMLIFLSSKFRFGIFGIIGAGFISMGIYVSNVFNQPKNENSN